MIGGPSDAGGQMWGNSEVQMFGHAAFMLSKSRANQTKSVPAAGFFGSSNSANEF
jgi:hypothetical protein